jgi:hypothetical protein
MPPRCARCGNVEFKTFHEYEIHRFDFHGVKPQIKPIRITGRTKEQIVRDAENTYLKDIIVPTGREVIYSLNEETHLPACCCDSCFQMKLDRLVEESTKALQNSETGGIL